MKRIRRYTRSVTMRSRDGAELAGFAALVSAAYLAHPIGGLVSAGVVLLWYGNRPKGGR